MGYLPSKSEWGTPISKVSTCHAAGSVPLVFMQDSLSFKWNAIRLDGPTLGIVTKTVHKTLPGGGGGQGSRVVEVKGVGCMGSKNGGGGFKGIGGGGGQRGRWVVG